MNAYNEFEDSNINSFDPIELDDISEEQFIVFARLILKDNILEVKNEDSWQADIKYEVMIKINKFFDTLSEDMLHFENDLQKKILLKYIVSNLNYGFGISLDDEEINRIYDIINDLADVDPRNRR